MNSPQIMLYVEYNFTERWDQSFTRTKKWVKLADFGFGPKMRPKYLKRLIILKIVIYNTIYSIHFNDSIEQLTDIFNLLLFSTIPNYILV